MRLVSADELRALVPMSDAVAAMRDAFVGLAAGGVDEPQRMALSDGSALAMMARGNPGSGTLVKVVAIRSDNRERGFPNVHALGTWLDGPTGRPLFLIDGETLTSLRTGAISGAATAVLADPAAKVLAVIGAGGQAPDQIRGVVTVRAIEEVRIVSHSSSAALLADRLAPEFPGVRVRAVATVSEATAGADVVCCATNSSVPVVWASQLRGRVHVNAIGSYRAAMRELAPDVLAQASQIVVDRIEAANAEAGEIIDALAAGVISQAALIEFGRLLMEPPREPAGLTVFKSVGVAVQDWAIAELLRTRLADGSPDGNGIGPEDLSLSGEPA